MLAVTILLSAASFSLTVHADYENTWVNTGNKRTDLAGVAKTQIGYTEGTNNGNKYSTAFGQSNVNWCAYFVVWCARQAGIDAAVIRTSGYASPLAGCLNVPYYDPMTYEPQTGDLIFFDWSGHHAVWSHVGIVTLVTPEYVYTIEGNSADRVSRNKWDRADCRIRAYGVPDYDLDQPIRWDHVYSTDITASSAMIRADVSSIPSELTEIGAYVNGEKAVGFQTGSVLNYCSVQLGGTNAEACFEGLSPDTTYSYYFYAVTKTSQIITSDPRQFTTTGTEHTAIRWDNVCASDITDHSAQIQADFTAPDDTIKEIGVYVNGEKIFCRAADGGEMCCSVQLGGPDAQAFRGDLKSGTTYSYSFYAVTEHEEIISGETAFFTTEDAPLQWNGIYALDLTQSSALLYADVTSDVGQIREIGAFVNGEKVIGFDTTGNSRLTFCSVQLGGSDAEALQEGLSPGTRYSFSFYARTTQGEMLQTPVYYFVTRGDSAVSHDLNGDAALDLKDVATLKRYLAGGFGVVLDVQKADMNADGVVDLKDAALLKRFLAGGFGVVLA